MTREIFAHHDPAVLTSSHLAAALRLHSLVPALSLVELLERAARKGREQTALTHAARCTRCRTDALCSAGLALVAKIRPTRRRRPRP